MALDQDEDYLDYGEGYGYAPTSARTPTFQPSSSGAAAADLDEWTRRRLESGDYQVKEPGKLRKFATAASRVGEVALRSTGNPGLMAAGMGLGALSQHLSHNPDQKRIERLLAERRLLADRAERELKQGELTRKIAHDEALTENYRAGRDLQRGQLESIDDARRNTAEDRKKQIAIQFGDQQTRMAKEGIIPASQIPSVEFGSKAPMNQPRDVSSDRPVSDESTGIESLPMRQPGMIGPAPMKVRQPGWATLNLPVMDEKGGISTQEMATMTPEARSQMRVEEKQESQMVNIPPEMQQKYHLPPVMDQRALAPYQRMMDSELDATTAREVAQIRAHTAKEISDAITTRLSIPRPMAQMDVDKISHESHVKLQALLQSIEADGTRQKNALNANPIYFNPTALQAQTAKIDQATQLKRQAAQEAFDQSLELLNQQAARRMQGAFGGGAGQLGPLGAPRAPGAIPPPAGGGLGIDPNRIRQQMGAPALPPR